MGGIIIVSYVLGFSILSWVNWREWNSHSFEVVERSGIALIAAFLFFSIEHCTMLFLFIYGRGGGGVCWGWGRVLIIYLFDFIDHLNM